MRHHFGSGSATRLQQSSATSTSALAALAGASVVAWLALAGWEPPLGLAGFLAGWTLMMAGMMLPSVGPLALLYRGPRSLLAVGYLAVWGAIGVLPLAAMEWGLEPAVPIVLAFAGIYELTPLKSACLRRCRSAPTFLMERYRSGPFRLGAEHAVWCAGCCVGLMAVLVLAAAMGLVWAAAIAAVVFIQKALPFGELSARFTGVGLLAAALAVGVT